MLLFACLRAGKQEEKNNILREASLCVTRVCDACSLSKKYELPVDRLTQNRYNTSCVSVENRNFMSTAVREGDLTRRRVSAAPQGSAGKNFLGGKTKWLLLAPISPRRSSAPRSTASARECPLPTAARFLPVVVHAAAPVSPTKSGSNLRIVCYR